MQQRDCALQSTPAAKPHRFRFFFQGYWGARNGTAPVITPSVCDVTQTRRLARSHLDDSKPCWGSGPLPGYFTIAGPEPSGIWNFRP